MANPVVDTPIPDQSNRNLDGVSLDVSGNFSDADVTDSLTYTISGLPVGTGLSIDSATGRLSGSPTQQDINASPITAVVTATDEAGNRASASFAINGPADQQFESYRNQIAGTQIGAVYDIFDANEPNYLWARWCHFGLFQLVGMYSGTSRANEWATLFSENPILHAMMHESHWDDWPAYRNQAGDAHRLHYEYAIGRDHSEVLVGIDQDNKNTTINIQEKPASAFGATGVHLNIVDQSLREYGAKVAVDVITGSNLTGDQPRSASGPDLSANMSWFNDATSVRMLKSNKQLKDTWPTDGVGLVDDASVTSTHASTVDIIGRPGSGVIGEEVIFFNTNRIGFVGYGITGYSEITIGASTPGARLTLDSLPGTAHATQLVVPASGMRYAISDTSDARTNADWDGDGVASSPTDAQSEWIPSFLNFGTLVDTYMQSVNGKENSHSWNGISDGFLYKENNGWPVPHGMAQSEKGGTGENYSSARLNYKVDAAGGQSTAGYKVSQVDQTRNMRGLEYANTYYKPLSSQNDWERTRPGTILLEHMIWGEPSTNPINTSPERERVAAMGRYWMFLSTPFEGVTFSHIMWDGRNDSMTMEESFLDFEGITVDKTLFGTYREDSGTDGSNGPLHDYDWNTAHWGERGFRYRAGNYLWIGNCADFPYGYGDEYNPTTMPSGGWPARPTLDQFLPTDFAALYTDGILASGETLQRLDFTTEHNAPLTNRLLQEVYEWNSTHKFGPEGPFPWDGDGAYTVANHPWIIRDRTVNDGTAINQSVALDIGPNEAICLRIV